MRIHLRLLIPTLALCKITRAAINETLVSQPLNPPCCEASLQPGPDICQSTFICCPDGTWGCGLQDTPGVFLCSEIVVTDPTPGKICPQTRTPTPSPTENKCCVAETKPDCAKAACCEDGTWTCPSTDGTYLCNGQVVLGSPKGKVCDECCIDHERPPCPIGDWACCSDGTLLCPDPATGLYTCGDVPVQQPLGRICCCDPTTKPSCIGGREATCCGDGSWACPVSPTGPVSCPGEFGFETARVCPCCDPALEPGPNICDEGHMCCPDGSWGCSIVGKPGFYGCSGIVVTQPPVGIICPPTPKPTPGPTPPPDQTPTLPPTKIDCCVAETKPDCAKAACCEDGTWTCPSTDGTYLCNGQVVLGSPKGKVCDECCIDHERPPCPIGDWACCSDGTLLCPDPATGLYTCGDVPVQQPLGRICCCDPTTKPSCIGGREATCCGDGSWACPVSPTGPVSCPGEFGFETARVCPCCDPALEPGPNICDEGHMCCPDGSWGCSIVGKPGFYGCSGIVVTQPPVGIICPPTPKPTPGPTPPPDQTPTLPPTKIDCCVAETKPDCAKAACCEDGTWTCPSTDGTYLCNGQVVLGSPKGKVCDECCIDHERPPCPIGDWACCSDGTLLCPDPATGLYTCGDVPVKQPLGRICCCDPTTKPSCVGGREATCCGNGSWACPVSPTGPVSCPGEFGFETARVCPCCDPALEPGPNICDEGHMCCPDGSWGCSIVGKPGFYGCSGIVVTQPPVGIICPLTPKPTPAPVPTLPPTTIDCCVTEAKPKCVKAACCEDGTWTCPLKSGGYLCKGQIVVGSPIGKICKECCIDHERPRCPVGDWGCCSDGTLQCPDPLTGRYVCGGVGVVKPLGSICCCNRASQPFCLFGSVDCCKDGSWRCPGSNQCVLGNGNVCATTGGGIPWMYEEPIWWKSVSTGNDNVKRCSKRMDAPAHGSLCGPKNKTCYFGTQSCGADDFQPVTKCNCNGHDGTRGSWSCEDILCSSSQV